MEEVGPSLAQTQLFLSSGSVSMPKLCPSDSVLEPCCELVSVQTHYEDEEYIIRQGARGDTFFIISKGKVAFNNCTNLLLVTPTSVVLIIWYSQLPSGECDPGGPSQSGDDAPPRAHQGRLVWRKGITGVRSRDYCISRWLCGTTKENFPVGDCSIELSTVTVAVVKK